MPNTCHQHTKISISLGLFSRWSRSTLSCQHCLTGPYLQNPWWSLCAYLQMISNHSQLYDCRHQFPPKCGYNQDRWSYKDRWLSLTGVPISHVSDFEFDFDCSPHYTAKLCSSALALRVPEVGVPRQPMQ